MVNNNHEKNRKTCEGFDPAEVIIYSLCNNGCDVDELIEIFGDRLIDNKRPLELINCLEILKRRGKVLY